MDTNTQGARCDTALWHNGTYYQWIWENEPCVYTGDFLVGYYFYLLLYLLFDVVRRKIIGHNPSHRLRLAETGVWLAFYWFALLGLYAKHLIAGLKTA